MGASIVGLDLASLAAADAVAAAAAEELGYDAVFASGPDGASVLAAIAGATNRIRIGLLAAPGATPAFPSGMPDVRRAAAITVLDDDPASLDVVARTAEAWADLPRALVAHAATRDALATACRAHGRDPASLGHALLVPLLAADREKDVRDQLERALASGAAWAHAGASVQGTPDVVVPRLRDYADLGVATFVLMLPDPRDRAQLEWVAFEVADALREA